MTSISRPSSLLNIAPVIPVVVVHDIRTAVPLARALVAGGLHILEVTLRTDAALQAIELITAEVPDILVGAGTITSSDQARQSVDAGAHFLVSPGCTDRLLDAMDDSGLPYLPGVATVSEMLKVLDRRKVEMKFFPAGAAGGIPYLQAVAGPLPQIRFCPTGGITAATVGAYLGEPNVGCVGGSWVTPPDAIWEGDWKQITQLARGVASWPNRDGMGHRSMPLK
ncbi:2-dehydro-3-deoxyphosphogluconate aldolase/4-hydroxy-2-oxoglutarate aldolase [Parafrankia sp. EAN1pec]|uniref:bifunctional 4-hydroxy-2-oxoglutarate aldolase/2-dehydro-3-deoxy-phosphogluconate aldolase n=2 Tax=Parafrankia sp. (strain EAN1pec) TaxID=298653 RepID=UPI00005437FF|nr:2-dehydro-3-deoxyphosphogluconate aldolase/4-hydroxy-2-oxoglutarate aldolase [Frankia sp. EAN1pec]